MKLRSLRLLRNLIIIGASLYVVICASAYFLQEKLLFFPTVIPQNYQYQFDGPFEEVWIDAEDGTELNGLLFKADSSRGLVFFLHGNGGCAMHWANAAELYTKLGYDMFAMNYRGYGKSDGTNDGEDQFYSDVDAAYSEMLSRYSEQHIIVIGFSIGSAAATRLAALNDPKQLILHAPYFSLLDMMQHRYKILPGFLLKYPFRTNEIIEKVKCPITIFHGTADQVIYFASSEKLMRLVKTGDRFFPLKNEGHNGISSNATYVLEITELLDL